MTLVYIVTLNWIILNVLKKKIVEFANSVGPDKVANNDSVKN